MAETCRIIMVSGGKLEARERRQTSAVSSSGSHLMLFTDASNEFHGVL